MASLSIYEAKKFAFKDNLTIWNTMGHIQMTSIEMKEYLKRLSVEDVDEWEQRTVIKSAYTAIYETSKKLVDTTGDIIKFINLILNIRLLLKLVSYASNTYYTII